MKNKTIIDSFRGEFAFLSNFYESVIYVDGQKYLSVEHAYQSSKTLDPFSKKLIREAKTPGQAKKLGKSVKLRHDWESVKIDLMKSFIVKKFENPFLRPLLLETGDAELIEANTWNDSFWGTCKGEGQNWLGKLLMCVRAEIVQENDDAAKSENVTTNVVK